MPGRRNKKTDHDTRVNPVGDTGVVQSEFILPANGLRGRSTECELLDDALRDARRGRAVVVNAEGEPGAGKSALCRYAAAQAETHGDRVVYSTSVEGEADLALAGLSAVLRPLVPAASALPRGQRRAIRAAAGLSDDVVTDRFALGAATLGLLAGVAETGPLVLVVDDAQWLDPASADALSFAARRLGADAVMLLLASRPDQCRLALDKNVRHLVVAAMDCGPLASMLADAGLPVGPGVDDAIHAATGGLPLPTLETAAALSATQRDGSDPLPDPLPVGRRVTEAYRARLFALPQRTQHALAVAVAAGSAPGNVLADGLAELGLGVEDLEPAEDAGILTLSALGEVIFAHPLLRAAAFGLLRPAARRRAHGALAIATQGDPDRHARHLLCAATGPVESVAAALETSAAQAQRRAGPAAAAPLFLQAVTSSPPGEQRCARQLTAAQALGLAGRRSDALRHAREVVATTTDPSRRSEALIVVVASSIWAVESEAMTDLAVELASRIAPLDPARAARALVLASSAATSHGAVADAISLAEKAYRLGDHSDIDSITRVSCRHIYAMTLVVGGRHSEAIALLEDQIAVPPTLDVAEVHRLEYPSLVQTLVRLGRLEPAQALLRDLLKVCGQGSAPTAKAYVLGGAVDLMWWQGRWAEAVTTGDEATTLAQETDQDVLSWYTRATTARVLAAQGREEECRRQVEAALDGARSGFRPVRIYGLSALGLLELGRDNYRAAAALLQEADVLRRSCGCYDPRIVPLGPDLIEAHVRADDLPAARRALDDYAGMAEASNTPWALATAARCHALVVQNSDEAERLFAEALDQHSETEGLFDTARTRLCWGEHRRRRRNITGSRELLRQALHDFRVLGADPWMRRAAAELRAAGEHPSLPPAPEFSSLSPQELRCALAAASGMSNREAAAELFISPKTVEYHLGKVFLKLGLTSRNQLTHLVLTSNQTRIRD